MRGSETSRLQPSRARNTVRVIRSPCGVGAHEKVVRVGFPLTVQGYVRLTCTRSMTWTPKTIRAGTTMQKLLHALPGPLNNHTPGNSWRESHFPFLHPTQASGLQHDWSGAHVLWWTTYPLIPGGRFAHERFVGTSREDLVRVETQSEYLQYGQENTGHCSVARHSRFGLRQKERWIQLNCSDFMFPIISCRAAVSRSFFYGLGIELSRTNLAYTIFKGSERFLRKSSA